MKLSVNPYIPNAQVELIRLLRDIAQQVNSLTDSASDAGGISGIVDATDGASVAPGSTITVTLKPQQSKFCVIRLMQVNRHGDENPLRSGFIVAPPAQHLDKKSGGMVRKTFTLEHDTVSIKYAVSGKYYLQTASGIPADVGVLTYFPLLGDPVEVGVAS